MASCTRNILIACLLALPSAAHAQAGSSDSLIRRLTTLEHRVDSLQARIRALEGASVDPSTARLKPGAAKWRVRANWRALRQGMTMSEVRALLGEPDHVNAPAMIIWSWGTPPDDAGVFFSDNKLAGWSEPKW